MDTKNQAVTASWINVIAGLWLILAPFVLSYTNAAQKTNSIWLGIIVGVLALIRAFTPASSGTVWLSWINIIAGIWLIVSPFVLGAASSMALWNNIIIGAIVLLDAIWNSAAGGNAASRIHVST